MGTVHHRDSCPPAKVTKSIPVKRRWGPEGPPAEAYSRSTNAERFQPLHSYALETVGRLKDDFEVECAEGYWLDLELETGLKTARPSVRLSPVNTGAAPTTVAFSAYPGLRIRFGRWHTRLFPVCGCDACDESAEGEVERLNEMIENLTAGRFREVMRRALFPFIRRSWTVATSWSSKGHSSTSRSYLDRSRARRLYLSRRRLEMHWEPWRHRNIR